MAAHDVYMSIPTGIVLHKDVEFEVYADDSKIGTLKISKGSVEWVPSHHQYGYHLDWEDFGKLMREHGQQYRDSE